MANFYIISTDLPQPIRKVKKSVNDVIHVLKMGERIDNLADKYYNDPTLARVIMYANPEWDNEFEIPIGTSLRIPLPLQRVFDDWSQSNEI